MRMLLINGPNLNMLGRRAPNIYGQKTLPEIEAVVRQRGAELGVEVVCFQSNSEGAIVDFLQAEGSQARGVIINPGALSHYGLSLREALADLRLPVAEVHISNIYAREEWRHNSVIAPIAKGQISGFGWRGYIVALELLFEPLQGPVI